MIGHDQLRKHLNLREQISQTPLVSDGRPHTEETTDLASVLSVPSLGPHIRRKAGNCAIRCPARSFSRPVLAHRGRPCRNLGTCDTDRAGSHFGLAGVAAVEDRGLPLDDYIALVRERSMDFAMLSACQRPPPRESSIGNGRSKPDGPLPSRSPLRAKLADP
jgi:hypothetical protein